MNWYHRLFQLILIEVSNTAIYWSSRSLRPASLCGLVLNLRMSFRQRKRHPVCPNPAHNNNKGQPWQPSIPYELLLLPYRQLWVSTWSNWISSIKYPFQPYCWFDQVETMVYWPNHPVPFFLQPRYHSKARERIAYVWCHIWNNTWTYGALPRSVSSYVYSIVNWARV